MSLEELAIKHGTSLNCEEPHLSKGITQAEADKRLAEFGPNQLTPPKGLPEWVKFLLKVRARSVGNGSGAALDSTADLRKHGVFNQCEKSSHCRTCPPVQFTDKFMVLLTCAG